MAIFSSALRTIFSLLVYTAGDFRGFFSRGASAVFVFVFRGWDSLSPTAVSFFYAHRRGVLPDGTQRTREGGD